MKSLQKAGAEQLPQPVKKKSKFKEWLELREAFDLETSRVANFAIGKLGYGMGRPKVQGDNLIYATADPEDAEMISNEIPQQLARWGIKGTANAQGKNIIVTIGVE